MGVCYDAGLGRCVGAGTVFTRHVNREHALSRKGVYHTLTCGLRQVLGKTTSLFLWDEDILTVLSVHARAFLLVHMVTIQIQTAALCYPLLHEALPSCHPTSELFSLLMGWFTYNQIHLVCVYSLKFGNWMRLGYDHHDPDVRHWRSYHMTLSGQIPFFSSYSSIHRSWVTTSEFFLRQKLTTSPGWPGIPNVDQAYPGLGRDLPASASYGVRLKMCATMHRKSALVFPIFGVLLKRECKWALPFPPFKR